MEESKTVAATLTKFPPCCLRIFRDKYILVGTYELDKPTGNRTGTVDVYDDELVLVNSYPCYGAVLDLKLSPFDATLVISAHSTGNVMLWKVECESRLELKLIKNIQVFEIETLITSLHFSPLKASTVLLTATSGEAVTINIETGDVTFSSNAVEAYYSKVETKALNVQGISESIVEQDSEPFSTKHSLECWTGEFGALQPLADTVFTGGDDATIMGHDLRSHDVIWTNNRIHEAGVVGIKCSTQTFRTSKPTSIVTGSYDDQIRSFDFRMLGADSIYPGQNIPVLNSQQLNLGGGVWRFSEAPINLQYEKDTLLVCCMYNGTKIVTINDLETSNADEQFQEIHYLKNGHDSMCYGGDWSSRFIATCSFYDKSLQKWNP
ncbi:hypothetical protein TPHA_0J02070 [Tetrapisispora phaffii CBS 4417]|uniref:methylated diphthine methylhydrolase n=1 Tax=Tetrapisispora phaffii (strain ATCC 24235 / CBS 4417 / NBRC 1672 / NRRL Y-8282 / UCD 70-5) TaxID=1071381 RepID=G8BYT5_TETPH|nr:hypothetical protein TPHA_0J02070 [Tetrapisispora phaffii CBS 4417]CCE65027.1 hypothetical protein TPHA_0J02070 [Tetrapisispora phaffii CBS 4417]